MSASEKFFEAMSSLQGEENNYQENFDAIKQLNAISDPESFGLQAFQNFAEIFAPHLISEGLGSMFAGGSTVAKVASKVVKGDFQGAIKEGTDAVGSRVQSVVEDAVQNVRQQASSLSDAVQSGQTGLADAVEGLANQATGGLAQITENVTNIANQAGSDAGQAFSSLIGRSLPPDIVESMGDGTYAQLAAASRLAGVEPLQRIGNVVEQPVENLLGDIEMSEMTPFRGLEGIMGAARSQVADILQGRITGGQDLSESLFNAATEARTSLVARAGLNEGESVINTFTRPLDVPGTTSNQIGDIFNAAMRGKTELPSIPEGNIASDFAGANVQDTVEGIATGARSLATGAVQQVAGVAEGLTQQVTGAATQAVTQLEGATQSVTQALSDVGPAVQQGVGSIVKSVLPGVAEDALDEVTAGAEAGPEGLLIGGALALGTFLVGLFTHHSSSIPEPPPITLSQPILTAGLSNA